VPVSDDTLRRWIDAGRISADAEASGGRATVAGTDLARLAEDLAGHPDRERTRASAVSARNRLTGIVTKVTRDTVMAQVELQAGPHRIVSLMSREAADELALDEIPRRAAHRAQQQKRLRERRERARRVHPLGRRVPREERAPHHVARPHLAEGAHHPLNREVQAYNEDHGAAKTLNTMRPNQAARSYRPRPPSVTARPSATTRSALECDSN